MLDLDSLLAVRRIVTHDNCADGVASAIILRDALPNARVEFVQYNTPAHRDLRATDGMLFCDMTPPAARVQEFVDAGAIVLDHHKGARDIVDAFGERGVFADEATDPGVSGATLAFREAWSRVVLHHGYSDCCESVLEQLATLAGIRDTWQRNDSRWREACAQAAALRFWPPEMLIGAPVDALAARLEIGDVLLQRDAERDERSIAEAYRFEVSGIRVVAFEGLHTSDIAERLEDEADLVLGWHYAMEDGRARMVVSGRSRGAVSALALAKANGGGGHERAAGFRVDVDCMDPYTTLRLLVWKHASAMRIAA
jgi:oligoribonuclease NrnB/cAMP/cGMP phosphodiesterase (DHH superfamily)